jgi:hypothetical protein
MSPLNLIKLITVSEGDLGQRIFYVFSLLKSEYRYKSMDLLFLEDLLF